MTSWSEYVHYDCDDCGEICINHSETDRAQLHLCQDCHRDVVLEEVEQYLLNRDDSASTTSERAEGAAPSHGGPTDRVSARGRPKGRPQSQRESPADGPERGCGVQSLLNSVDSFSLTDE